MKPNNTYNLTSDRTVPSSTYAKFVVDTASSLGQQGDKGFFKNQAQTHIARALDALYEIQADVTLENVYSLLLDERDMDETLRDLGNSYPTERRAISSTISRIATSTSRLSRSAASAKPSRITCNTF